MGRWVLYAGMFLFGVFVVYMALMMVLASFVRIYQAIDSATCSSREIPTEDLRPRGLNSSPLSCHSGVTQAGEKTHDDVARTRVADGALHNAPVGVE